MQIKGCTRATRKLRVTTRICKCECEMHCLVACRMLESNTTGWSFCKNPPPTPTLNTSTWNIKANWGNDTKQGPERWASSTQQKLCHVSQSTGRGRLCGWIFLKPWPHHYSLDKILRGNSASGILKIASTMVGAGLIPSGLSWNPVQITFGVLDLYLAGFSSSSSCCIRSRKLWRFSSWSFSASSCVIPHQYLRTDQQCYRDLSFLPGHPAVSFDIPRFAGDSLGQT